MNTTNNANRRRRWWYATTLAVSLPIFLVIQLQQVSLKSSPHDFVHEDISIISLTGTQQNDVRPAARHGARRQLLLDVLFSLFGDSTSVTTPTLSSVRQINDAGFGDRANQYSFSMASFNGNVFVGTLNAPVFRFTAVAFFLGFGNLGPFPLFPTNGSQVYRGTRADDGTWTFDKVLDFQDSNPDNYGSRVMLVVGDTLYLATANHVGGLEVWQTTGNGDEWQRVSEPGFGDDSNISGRGMAECGGYLYVGAENRSTGAQIFRHKVVEGGGLDDSSDWERVGELGFGDTFNFFVSEFVVYQGSLYGSTLNGLNGAELWRTAQCGNPVAEEVIFENVIRGGLGNRLNQGILTMRNINDAALLIGTVNYLQGASLFIDDGSGSEFRLIFDNGWTSFFNSYVWAIEEFQGRIYLGTYNVLGGLLPWSTFQLFSVVLDESTLEIQDMMVEDRRGFSSFGQYGIRNMVAHDDTLVIGTAGVFLTSGTLVFEGSNLE